MSILNPSSISWCSYKTKSKQAVKTNNHNQYIYIYQNWHNSSNNRVICHGSPDSGLLWGQHG